MKEETKSRILANVNLILIIEVSCYLAYIFHYHKIETHDAIVMLLPVIIMCNLHVHAFVCK